MIRVGAAGDAKIDDLWHTAGGDQDVSRLEVAVNDALSMTVLHGGAHLAEDVQTLAGAEFLVLAVSRQCLGALDVLHRKPRPASGAVVPGACLIDLRNPVVAKTTKSLRLVLEAAHGTLGSHATFHHLERDRAAGRLLQGLVHHAHAALADHPLDAVLINLGADEWILCWLPTKHRLGITTRRFFGFGLRGIWVWIERLIGHQRSNVHHHPTAPPYSRGCCC